MTPNTREKEKLSGIEQVMPVSPSSFSFKARRLISSLNGHVGNQSLRLPLGQIISNNLDYLLFSTKVLVSDTSKKSLGTALVQRVGSYPLDAIQALPKDVAWKRYEIIFSPRS